MSQCPPSQGSWPCPDLWGDVVRQAMAKRPDDRFTNACAMATALEGAIAPRPSAQPTPSAPAPPPRPPQPPRSRASAGGGSIGGFPRWFLFGGIVIVAVAAIAIVIAATTGGDGDRVQMVVPSATETPMPTIGHAPTEPPPNPHPTAVSPTHVTSNTPMTTSAPTPPDTPLPLGVYYDSGTRIVTPPWIATPTPSQDQLNPLRQCLTTKKVRSIMKTENTTSL